MEHLVKEGVNGVVIDDSMADCIYYELDMLKYVKKTYAELEVIDGNVVTAAWTENQISVGADGLRVGCGRIDLCEPCERRCGKHACFVQNVGW